MLHIVATADFLFDGYLTEYLKRDALEVKMIGKIKRVGLREVWRHEAHDFTTWLEEEKWPEAHEAMIDAMIRLHKSLQPYLDKLEVHRR